MKILFSTYPLAFQNPGGGEQVFKATRSHLQTMGIQVDTYDVWKHTPENLHDYQIIHYFSCIQPSFWKFVKTHCPKTPLVVTPIFFREKKFLKSFSEWQRKLTLQMTKQNDPFTFPDYWLPATQTELQSLRNSYQIKSEKMSVLPHGVEDLFKKATPNIFQNEFKINESFILHVGRFHPVKNQLTLIQAMSKFKSYGIFIGSPDIGQEEYYFKCKKLAAEVETKTFGKTRFLFIPRLNHENPLLASAYAAADIFILPSHFETFGLCAFEAQLAGAKLVLSNKMLTASIFKDCAFFVDPNRSEQIAFTLQEALKAPKNPKNSFFLKKYAWNSLCRDLLEIYQSITLNSQQGFKKC